MAFIYNGGLAPENHVKSSIAVNFQLDYLSPSGNYDIPVPAGYRVDVVAANVTQAFNGTGTALVVGDPDDVDGYFTSANIAPATAATATVPAVKRSSMVANPYQYGKYFAIDGVVRLGFTQGTTPTTGVLKGTVYLTNLAKDGIPVGATTLIPL